MEFTTWQDAFNGSFELGGAVMAWLNVVVLYKAKRVAGVSVSVWTFFAAWGAWNLYYYPYLDQWASFWGGIPMVAANITWVIMAVRYQRRKIVIVIRKEAR